MKLQIVVISIFASTSLVLAALLYSEHQKHQRADAKLRETGRALAATQPTAEEKMQTIELLETKLNKITEVLSNSTARLRAAELAIQGYELEAEEARRKQETVKNLLADIPAPSVSVEHHADGSATTQFTFAKLLDRTGNVLAANATFAGQYGRRLVFRSTDVPAGAVAFDVDDVHPAILQHLSIDGGDAKAKQARIDAAWRAKAAADYQAALQDEPLRRTRWEAQERVRIEREKANAEIARQQAEQRAVEAAAYNERLKAEAAARMADAAMLQALNPPVVVNQNVNRAGY
jgi:hypothetical protein